jgi:predicted ribosome-associated RNA-binding protein Tma20
VNDIIKIKSEKNIAMFLMMGHATLQKTKWHNQNKGRHVKLHFYFGR